MTDTLGNENQVLDPKIRKQLKAARQDRKEVAKLKAELATERRLRAFAQAGIPSDARGEALAKVYDGPLEPEKIQAVFQDLFKVDPDSVTDGTETAGRIADAGKGETSPGSGTIEFADALRAARGDNEKVKELIRNAPPGAGIKLPDIY